MGLRVLTALVVATATAGACLHWTWDGDWSRLLPALGVG